MSEQNSNNPETQELEHGVNWKALFKKENLIGTSLTGCFISLLGFIVGIFNSFGDDELSVICLISIISVVIFALFGLGVELIMKDK